MNSSLKPLLATLRGEKTKLPFWFMRQAGRYLPEYRSIRAQQKDFLKFCYTPDLATEVTLQPIHRFGMSGAIIFSDILVVPHALGMDVHFEEGKGPILTPVRDEKSLSLLRMDSFSEKLAPVYEALKLTRKALPAETALIGFVGAPWTLACYVVEGKSGSDFELVKALPHNDRPFFTKLMALLTKAVILHAKNQVKAGAEIIQLFDSWSGILSDEAYTEWVIAPARIIIESIREEFPGVPVIAFPRQSGVKFSAYAEEARPDALSVDGSVPLEWIKTHLQPGLVVQGCLDPELLAGDKKAMMAETQRIISILGDKAFVFNLGHGILPHTPVENVQMICDFLKTA